MLQRYEMRMTLTRAARVAAVFGKLWEMGEREATLTVAQVAERAGMSERTARRALVELDMKVEGGMVHWSLDKKEGTT